MTTPENERPSTAGEEAPEGARLDDGPAESPTDGAETPDAAGSLDDGAAPGGDAAAPDDGAAPDGVAEGGGAEDGGDVAAEPSVEERLVAAEALAAAHWDRLVRLQAEMENQRKRAQRDVASARKFALDGIAGDLLPVKDSLELGIRAASADEASLSSLLEGSELTLKMLAQVLEKNAIVEIDPEGEKFDPEFHQAMSMQEVEGVPPNTVTGVMQKGYTLNERLLRPALVMVSK